MLILVMQVINIPNVDFVGHFAPTLIVVVGTDVEV
jgi:hypothetical protein